MTEVVTTRVSLHGRLADDLTRATVPGRHFQATVTGSTEPALRKEDGHFVFVDLQPSPTSYEIRLDAPGYQRRVVQASISAVGPVEVAFPGEDELIVIVTAVDAVNRRVSFDAVPFLPTIRADSQVFGPAAFNATLDDALEGGDVQFATLSTVAGLALGDLLRIVRSANLIVKPSSYYRFDPDMTLVAIKVVENTADDPPLSDVALAIDQVSAQPLTPVTVGGVVIHTVALGPVTLPLGPDRAIHATTNARGDAIFYYRPDTPVTSLRVNVTKAGYVSTSKFMPAVMGERTAHSVKLDRA